MWLVAFSLNGFFVYLGALDLAGVEPRTALTGAYYALLCGALLATTWIRRKHLMRRVLRAPRLAVIFGVAAGILVAWHSLNTLLFSEGELAYRLAGLLVLWSLPTALAAATFLLEDLRALAQGLATLATVFLIVVVVALARADEATLRFSPINELDAISAALVPALGAVAALFAWPGRPTLQLALTTALVGAAVLPGSRGPVVAMVAACLAVAVLWRMRGLAIVVALTLGIALGSVASAHLGTLDYLSNVDVAGLSDDPTREEGEPLSQPYSTIAIRRQLFETALSETPDRPIFGHGVGMLVDNTPEAQLMDIAGERVYPHNTFIEAAHALGAIGLVSFVVLVGAAGVALLLVVAKSGRLSLAGFLFGLGGFAFVSTNVSGAIGTDALLWVVAAAAVALYSDHARAPGLGV